MLDDTFAALTDEHFFKCKHDGNTFEIMDAIPLKDVQKIMVSEEAVIRHKIIDVFSHVDVILYEYF